MSHRSTKPLLPSDIVIPNEFKDFNILPDDMRNEIAAYLFSDDKCPLDAATKKQIKPKSKVILEFQHSFDKFSNIFKTKSQYFLKIPNFTLLFAATCLGLPLKNYRHIPMNFIQSFLDLLNPNSVDEDILDIIIPFTIYRVPYEEDQNSVERLILFLAKFFTPSVFLRHLLNCLEIYIKKNKILPFHIDTLALVYEKLNLDQNESRDIERIVLRPLENVRDNIRLDLACSELRKKIQLRLNDRSFYNNSSSSQVDPFPDQRSPITNARSVHIFDSLAVLLDEIEKGQYGSPVTILIQIKDELANYNEFPHRSPEPLLALALRTYSFQTSSDMQNMILALISQINTICDPFILLKIYLQMPTSLQFQGISSELIERCYRDFLNRRREELDRTPTYPESLFDNFNKSNIITPNTNEREVRSIESNNLDVRFEMEFRHLTDWDSAYDAVCAIWELIGRYKNEEIHDSLINKFDELEYAPKSFLVQGLRELEDQNPRSEDSENTIRQLEDYFNYNLKPNFTTNVTFSARPSSPRVPTRTYQSEPQKTTPISSSNRASQTLQDQSLKRKRNTSNGTLIKTGYKTNH